MLGRRRNLINLRKNLVRRQNPADLELASLWSVEIWESHLTTQSLDMAQLIHDLSVGHPLDLIEEEGGGHPLDLLEVVEVGHPDTGDHLIPMTGLGHLA